NARVSLLTHAADYDTALQQSQAELRNSCRLLGVHSNFIGHVPLEVDSQVVQFGNADAAQAYLERATAQMTGTPVALGSDATWQPVAVQPIGDTAHALIATSATDASGNAMTATTILFRMGRTCASVEIDSNPAGLAGSDRASALAQISATRMAHPGLAGSASNG